MKLARIDPEERQLARKGVGYGLEDKGAERLGRGHLPLDRLLGPSGRDLPPLPYKEGGGKYLTRLSRRGWTPMFFDAAAAHDRNDLPFPDAFLETPLDLFILYLVAVQVPLHDLVIHLDGGLDELLPILGRFGCKLGWDIDCIESARLVVLEHVCLHGDQVNDPLERLFLAHRNLDDHNDLSVKLFRRSSSVRSKSARSRSILLMKMHSRNSKLVGIVPDLLSLDPYP